MVAREHGWGHHVGGRRPRGHFSALGVLPLAQLGFAVAFGVLLDALVVRSLLVPSLTYLIGPRTWWPGRLAGVADEVEPA